MLVTIDDFWLTFVVGTALPAVTALVTNRLAHPGVKALVLVFLSIVTGWATALLAQPDHSFDLKSTVIGIFVAYITAVASHFGLLAPAGVTGKNGAIALGAPAGIGSSIQDPRE